MADEHLKTGALLRLMSENAGLIFLAAMGLLYFPSAVEPQIYASANHVLMAEQGDTPVSIFNIPRPETVDEFVWQVPVDFPHDLPVALQLAGPFSAEVYWNNQLVGEKGQPAVDALEERAGPIDFLAPISQSLIEPEGNEVRILFSSHRAGYEPSSIIQSLMLVPYRQDERRELRYYGPLILISGTLVGLAGAIIFLSRERRFPTGLWLAGSIAGLILAGGAEASRSLINYAYDWHQFRQAVQLFGFLISGTALLRFMQLRWPLPGWPTLAIWGAVVMAILAATAGQTGYDARSVSLIILLMILEFIWIMGNFIRVRSSAALLSPYLIACLILSTSFPGYFLDQLAYVTAAAGFGHLLIRQAKILLPIPVENPAPLTFAVPGTSETVYLILDDIISLKAAGNYTEIRSCSGRVTLDGRSLSAVMELMPENFLRVHRSWAVNLREVDSFRSRPGSRYFLVLTTGENIPVGRSHVETVRRRLG